MSKTHVMLVFLINFVFIYKQVSRFFNFLFFNLKFFFFEDVILNPKAYYIKKERNEKKNYKKLYVWIIVKNCQKVFTLCLKSNGINSLESKENNLRNYDNQIPNEQLNSP